MPRFPFVRRSRDPEVPFLGADGADAPMSEAERSRRALVQLGSQLVIGFMVVVAVLYWAISSLFGGGIFIPSTAEGVLSSVYTPTAYAWTSESVREANLAGDQVEEDAFRSAVVDLGLNKSQDLAIGVFPGTYTWLSDGVTTGSYTSVDQTNGSGWQLVNNVCEHQPAVPASDLAIPTAADLEAAHPKIISDQGTVVGDQAWVIGFTPTPAILAKIFWEHFFDAVTTATPAARDWVLSAADRAAVDSGHIRLVYAYAWVTRAKPRELRQIELKFYTSENSGWRFLVKLYPSSGRPLAATTFGPPNCGGKSGSTTVPTLVPQPKSP